MKKPGRISYVIFLSAFALLFAAGPLRGQGELRILVSNDDGWDAPGIIALAAALKPLGRVTVVAPAVNNSAAGHSMTFRDPIPVREVLKDGVTWHIAEARPATCVRLGLNALLPEKPDVVVSGINGGDNLGVVTFYSATVGCAREAAFEGVPAIAVSLEGSDAMDYGPAAAFTAALVRELAQRGRLKGVFLNVNVPGLPAAAIKGVRLTRQDMNPMPGGFERRVSPKGGVYFWALLPPQPPGPKGTDTWATANGYISVTPFSVDQTLGAGAGGRPDIRGLEFVEKIKIGN